MHLKVHLPDVPLAPLHALAAVWIPVAQDLCAADHADVLPVVCAVWDPERQLDLPRACKGDARPAGRVRERRAAAPWCRAMRATRKDVLIMRLIYMAVAEVCRLFHITVCACIRPGGGSYPTQCNDTICKLCRAHILPPGALQAHQDTKEHHSSPNRTSNSTSARCTDGASPRALRTVSVCGCQGVLGAYDRLHCPINP